MGEMAARGDEVPVARARTIRPKRRRVLVEDARRDGSYLRATWHPEGQIFVVSTWRDEVCTGAIRVPVAASADLAGLIVDGMADAVDNPPTTPQTGPWDTLRATMRRWMHQGRTQAATWRGQPRV